jgi:hypothetical protein
MAAAIVATASIIPVPVPAPALHNYTELFPPVGQP